MKFEELEQVDEKFLLLASTFAKRKCKECYGRGYQIFDQGKYTRLGIKHCSCVDNTRKKINKQVK